MIRVAIVEDDAKTAVLLRQYIESDDIAVEAVYGSGEEAVQAISSVAPPDVVLMDIGLPGMSGIEATRRLKAAHPGLEIVIQTVFEDSATIIEAIKAGASGYVVKASGREDYRKALMDARAGGSFLSGKIARKVLQEFSESRARPAREGRLEDYRLTPREEEIMRRLIDGETYKQIAAELGSSPFTVNNHIRRIYEKLQVNSRAQAVARLLKP